MKKITLLLALLLLLLPMAGCGASMERAVHEAEILAYYTNISENAPAAAEAMMHPSNEQVQAGTFAEAFDGMVQFTHGRTAVSAQLQEYDRYAKLGTNDTTEYGIYLVTLEDGTVLTVRYTYLENDEGSGFAGFQLSVSSQRE